MKSLTEENQWTSIIKPHSGWLDISITELWRYRDLILLFVRRDFLAIYKQTILGPVWFLLQPLLSTLVFTVVFGNIAQISTDGLPHVLFYMAGIVSWNYFANCLTNISDTFFVNADMFRKVYFPRLAVAISVVITNLITFAIQISLFLAFWLYFYFNGSPINPNPWILLTPVLIIQTAVLGLGMGALISSMTVKYRDLAFVVGFGVQLWMYATPVIYPLSQVPLKWQWIVMLNPMAAVIEIFRYAFLGSGTIQFWQLGLSLGMTALFLALGIVLFSRVEKTFMDTV